MTIVSSVEDFPADAQLRKNVIVLSKDDFSEAKKNYEAGKFLLDEQIIYLVKPNSEDIKKGSVLEQMYNDSLLQQGEMLVADPTQDGRYLPYESLVKNTIQSQLCKFVELCQLMGAKKVILNSKTEQTNKQSTDANMAILANELVSFKAELKNTIAQDVLDEMQSVTEFLGKSTPNLEKAGALMKTGVFKDNEQIISFFNSVRHIENRMKKQTVKIKLAEELSKKLEVFAKLDVPMLKKSFGEAAFERVKKATQVTTVSYEVIF